MRLRLNISHYMILILLSVFPVVLTSVSGGSGKTLGYQVLVGVMFVFQIVIALSLAITSKVRIKKWTVYYLVLYILYSVGLLSILLLRDDYSLLDFVYQITRLLAIIIFLVIPSGYSVSKEQLIKLFVSIMLFTLISVLYSLVFEVNLYKSVLTASSAYQFQIKSFFLNRNSFAQLLLLTVVITTQLYLWSSRKLYFWIIVFLVIVSFFLLSRGALLSIAVFFTGLLLFALNFKSKIKILIPSLLILLIVYLNKDMLEILVNLVIRPTSGSTGRVELWFLGINVGFENSPLFGMGHFTGVQIMEQSGIYLSEFHSFYIETFVGGGLLDVILHGSIIILMISKLRRIKKFDITFYRVYIAFYVSIAVYGVVESISIFSMGYVGTMFTILLVTVPIVYYNSLSKGGYNNEIIK